MASVRNEIGRLRFEHVEMTQQQLAERIHVTRQTLTAVEHGKCSFSLAAAFRTAAVVSQPLESVFHFSSDERTGGRTVAQTVRIQHRPPARALPCQCCMAP